MAARGEGAARGRRRTLADRGFNLIWALGFGVVTALFRPALALAQSDGYFDRTRNVNVLERPRPDYDSVGVTLGSFTLFPTLTLAPEFDDNVFATDQDRQSDIVSVVQPAITGRSNWSRNALSFAIQDTSNIFAKHSEESTNDYSATAAGRFDLLQASNLNFNASYSSNTIPRTAENNITTSLQPVQYDLASLTLGALQGFSRFRVSESFNYLRTDYDNSFDQNGLSLNLNLLDNDQYTGNVRVDYGLTPEISFFVTGTANAREYPTSSLVVDRTSNGFETTFGADFDITQLIRGQVQLGYLQQDYQSTLFHTVSGPAVHMRVEYFLSGLTTLTARVDRSVVDAIDPTAISYLDTQASLRVDHELLRNFLLSLQASYETADFRGLERNDQRPALTASGTYLFNRYLGLTASYSFLNEASSGLNRVQAYQVDLVSISLVLRL